MAAMLNFKHIVIPVDFSDDSRQMLVNMSEWFAGADGQVFHFVHVWHAPALGYDEGVVAALKEKLEKVANSFSPSGQFQKEIVLLEGHPSTEICKFAKEKNCDLIALATHGHTGVKHLVIGSTAENIVRYASCPVLTSHISS
jgi:nucleotide-binding universal stress UspA family protein